MSGLGKKFFSAPRAGKEAGTVLKYESGSEKIFNAARTSVVATKKEGRSPPFKYAEAMPTSLPKEHLRSIPWLQQQS